MMKEIKSNAKLTDMSSGVYVLRKSGMQSALKKWLPQAQTWILDCGDCTLAIDSPAPEIHNFREIIEEHFNKPCILFCTHGHVDHTGSINEFNEVYMSSKDLTLVYGDGINRAKDDNKPSKITCDFVDVNDGEIITIGNRTFKAFSIPGHTLGSMALLDKETGFLFSGDAISHRILYGMSDWSPIKDYFKALSSLAPVPAKVYSAHDAKPLDSSFISYIQEQIKTNLISGNYSNWKSPVDGKIFAHVKVGKMGRADFFDFAILKDKLDSTIDELKEM